MLLALTFHVPLSLSNKEITATGGERKLLSREETTYLLKHMDKG